MKIQPRKTLKPKYFKDINLGDAFFTCESNPNTLWMKIKECECEADDSYCNAVDLANGSLAFFEDIEFINPVKATVSFKEI